MKKLFFYFFIVFLAGAINSWAQAPDPDPNVAVDLATTYTPEEISGMLDRFPNFVNGRIKAMAVEVNGPAYIFVFEQSLREVGFTDKETTDLIEKYKSEYKSKKAGPGVARKNIRVEIDAKRKKNANELEKKLAMVKPDWSSPEAQTAIKSWVEQNMLGGKPLEQVMGKDQSGKVNTDAVALLDSVYAPINLVARVNSMEGQWAAMDAAWPKNKEGEKDSLAGTTCVGLFVGEKVKELGDSLNLKIDDIATNLPKDKDGKLILAASQRDLEQKADQSYVDTEVARVETNCEANIDNLRGLTLKGEKSAIFVYASYMLKGDEAGFRAWLKPLVKEKELENEFDKIKSNAQEAKAKGLVRF